MVLIDFWNKPMHAVDIDKTFWSKVQRKIEREGERAKKKENKEKIKNETKKKEKERGKLRSKKDNEMAYRQLHCSVSK